jgi:hypothetical protein
MVYTKGSYPECEDKGWHLHKRLVAFAAPTKIPYLSIACLAYSEQLGKKRQQGGNADRM